MSRVSRILPNMASESLKEAKNCILRINKSECAPRIGNVKNSTGNSPWISLLNVDGEVQ